MTTRVEYHKAWRQKKKQSVEQLQKELSTLNEYCDTLLETTATVNAQLKKVAPLLELPDEELSKIIQAIQIK